MAWAALVDKRRCKRGFSKQMHVNDDAVEAELFEYNSEAELYSLKEGNFQHQTLGYRRFLHAADAVRFAIEELAPRLLFRTCLEVDDVRYHGKDIRRLYESAGYPYARRAVVMHS
jgi:hypothetical protein